jgi:hypothetical protein
MTWIEDGSLGRRYSKARSGMAQIHLNSRRGVCHSRKTAEQDDPRNKLLPQNIGMHF